jgi:hypothetical protein
VKRDHKPSKLNRALAYIKLGKYEDAVKDCTALLEYCEYLEDGFTASRDECFKAFGRRA